MAIAEKQTDEGDALRLAALRLLLGDDLALRLVEDQWNTVNDLSDPYEVRENTARFSLFSASLAVDVLAKLSEALHAPLMDLSKRRSSAMSRIPNEERIAWFSGKAPMPAIYAAETAAPFQGDPRLMLQELLEQSAPPGEFRMGDPAITVICRKRPNGSAWISVGDVTRGPHFQCDYHGDIKTGPTHCSDFDCEPPQWVVDRLGLSGS